MGLVKKTIVILDRCGKYPVEFCVWSGDYRRLDGVYIGSYSISEDSANELKIALDLFRSLGRYKTFPIDKLNKKTAVIVVGIRP